MRNRRRHNSSVEGLRLAIDCMPVATREAMLVGMRSNARIIVGAYVDGQGGECPMLAAHRRGGRTDFLSFAKSWDRFTRANGNTRQATEHEVRILTAQLEDSLASTSGLELDLAIKQHRELMGRRLRGRRRLPDAADPSGEIIAKRLRMPRRRSRADDIVASLPSVSLGLLQSLAGPHEHHLRDNARGGELEQVAHGLGDVLWLDHLVGGDLPLDEVGHGSVHERRA
jgi:hypothetical protein